jgi:hypothetical protein
VAQIKYANDPNAATNEIALRRYRDLWVERMRRAQ